jgi:predicted membrane-bound spermidine synthase
MSRAIFVFFFLSGLSALVFEVSWVRELSLFLGNTAQATSTVLAVFMGGLALGAFLGGKLIDRVPRDPLWVYGLLETAVGLLALTVGLILQSGSAIYVWLLGWLHLGDMTMSAVRLIMAATLLLLPTMLMGATLPVLVEYLEKRGLQKELFSILYGINTLGAGFGALLASFVGFPYAGIQGTMFGAAAINVTIGIGAVGLSRHLKSGLSPAGTESNAESGLEPAATNSAMHDIGTASVAPKPLYLVAFLTGFTALSYEVLWTRVLRCFVGSVTYAFSIMVAMFLLGLAIGSFLHERKILKSKACANDPFLTFASLQYLAAFACAGGWLLFPKTSQLSLDFIFAIFPSLQTHSVLYTILVCIPTMLVPAMFVGMLFPMLGTLAISGGENAATRVGKVYALNTIGCVCGSLVCGLVLVPTIGSLDGFRLIVMLSAFTGIFASFFGQKQSRRARLTFAAVPLALLIAYLSVHYDIRTVPPGGKTLATGEDHTGIISVVSSPLEGGLLLNVNNTFLSSSLPPARRYMRMLGHLPMLLHKHPEYALVGCFGTGTTAGACALHPELKHLDIIDLSPTVLKLAGQFRDVNYDVLKKPTVTARVNDVRNWLLSADRNYDVISFEPPPPSDAGIVNLYTTDFYRLASSRLNPDGILCQWIPMHLVSEPLWKMQIASARAVFPYVSVWCSNSREAIFIASKQPIVLDVDAMQKRIEQTPIINESLRDVGFDNAHAVLSTHIASGQPLDDYLKDTPLITDNFPRLEFFMAYPGRYLSELDIESIGNAGVYRFVEMNRQAKGFDQTEFWKHWQAIHLLRLTDKTDSNRIQVDKLINRCIAMNPANRWYQHVDSHRTPFYPTGRWDWKY